jgi:hypothetical protein
MSFLLIYDELAARAKAPNSKFLPKLFEYLADETDARILLALPADVPTLAGKLGLSTQDVEDRIRDLYLKGVVFPNKKTTPISYRMPRDMVHMHDTTVQWKDAQEAFLHLWQEWIDTEFAELAQKRYEGRKGKKPHGRVIAANI